MPGKFHFKKPGKRTMINIIILVVLIVINFSVVNRLFGGQASVETTYNEFLLQVEEKKIDTVQVENEVIYYTLKDTEEDQSENTGLLSILQKDKGAGYFYTIRMEDDDLVNRLENSGADFSRVKESGNSLLSFIFNFLFSFGLPLLIFYFMMRSMGKRTGGNFMSFGKSNAKVYVNVHHMALKHYNIH